MVSVYRETADYESLSLKAESAAVRADLFLEGLLHNIRRSQVLIIVVQSFDSYTAKKN
jgi:hypothetical protein